MPQWWCGHALQCGNRDAVYAWPRLTAAVPIDDVRLPGLQPVHRALVKVSVEVTHEEALLLKLWPPETRGKRNGARSSFAARDSHRHSFFDGCQRCSGVGDSGCINFRARRVARVACTGGAREALL